MATQTQKNRCYASSMRMLVRREHSTLELQKKLYAKGFDIELINSTISKLIDTNQQSDERFTDAFIQMRFNQGNGPLLIAMELKNRGIEFFDFSDFDFFTSAKNVRQMKFGNDLPNEFKEKAKQKRFLQSRGFDFNHIKYSLKK